jgi:hypothetical protein
LARPWSRRAALRISEAVERDLGRREDVRVELGDVLLDGIDDRGLDDRV